MTRQTVSLTTDASGDATAYTQPINGVVNAIVYTKTDFDNGVDLTITVEGSGINLWTEANVNASTIRSPRQPTHNQDGTAISSGVGPIAVANERIKVVVAQGGNAKTGKFDFIME